MSCHGLSKLGKDENSSFILIRLLFNTDFNVPLRT